MKSIKILGTGCPKCRTLAENAQAAVDELGVEGEVEKVTDITRIMDYGVMMTPALAVDGEVKSSGKVLSVAEIKALIQQ
ncbi:MAG: thioredoxin family protein [Planctomycetota bacterium]|nr:thioredoxin family protein [Planctomycetota bacterium]